ncbi:MAG TPA: MFS transporter [Actinomycetota bacterium]|nr:MFS transporter [Actinomycetota bacterium]
MTPSMRKLAPPPALFTGRARGTARAFYLINGCYTLSASVIWGVNTLFLLDAGLDIFGAFLANAFFTGAMVLFEVPTGVLADTKGRRLSFLWSVVILLASTVWYVLIAQTGGSLTAFCLASVAMGLGFTLYSGAVEAWVVDALRADGFDGPLDGLFARSAIVTGIAMLVGTVGGGFLGTADLSIPYIVRCALLAATFVISFLAMHDRGFAPRPVTLDHLAGEMRRVGRTGVTWGWREPRIRLLVWASFVQAGFLMWGWYAWQPYFLELLDSEAVWVAGAIAAASSLALTGGNSLVPVFSRMCSRRSTVLIWASAVSSAALVAVGLVDGFPAALASLLIAMVAVGVLEPVKQAYLHQIVPSEHRATVVSFNSMFGNGGGIVGQTGLGALARSSGIPEGYVVGGAATFVAVPIFLRMRRIGGVYDLGCEPPAPPPATAAQGLPEICTVDTGAGIPAVVGAQTGGPWVDQPDSGSAAPQL